MNHIQSVRSFAIVFYLLLNCHLLLAQNGRQTSQVNGKQLKPDNPQLLVTKADASSVATAQVTSSTSNANQAQFNRRPVNVNEQDDDDNDEEGERLYPGRRVTTRRPKVGTSHYDEDCDDDDAQPDYRELMRMASNPMRQFSRMMNRVLNQMNANADAENYEEEDDDYNGRAMGGLVSSTSAFSGGNGFSRMSSSVTNNGRTRGIVSETRNGKTETRRIGDLDDD